MRTLFFLVSIAIILQACGGKASTQQVRIPNDAVPVKLVALNSETVSTQVEASGLLATEEEASLSFKIGGIIENVLVAEGQAVRKGQLLATIKPTEIAAQVQQVQLSVDKALRDYQRVQNLYKDSVATLEQLQNAKTGLELAQQGYRQVAFNRQYASIYAPADGFIVKKMGSIGELASAGTPVLVMNAVSGASRWVLRIGLPDKQWALIRKGDQAQVRFDAYPGKIFDAVVTRKALAANPVNGAFEIEVQPALQGMQPGAGMFGKATIFASAQQQLYPIPYAALLEANGKNGFVFVSNDKKTAQRVPVTIGDIRQDQVYVSAGLQGHRYLVTSGSPYLTDNGRIKVIP